MQKKSLCRGRGLRNISDRLLIVVLDGVFVGFYHLFHHLTADGACFLGGEVAVVALLEVDANLACGLHLEFVECFLCLGNESFIAAGHNRFLSVAHAMSRAIFVFINGCGGSPPNARDACPVRSGLIMGKERDLMSGNKNLLPSGTILHLMHRIKMTVKLYRRSNQKERRFC